MHGYIQQQLIPVCGSVPVGSAGEGRDPPPWRTGQIVPLIMWVTHTPSGSIHIMGSPAQITLRSPLCFTDFNDWLGCWTTARRCMDWCRFWNEVFTIERDGILLPNLNNNWMAAVIDRSPYMTGSTTLRLGGDKIVDLVRLFNVFQWFLAFWLVHRKLNQIYVRTLRLRHNNSGVNVSWYSILTSEIICRGGFTWATSMCGEGWYSCYEEAFRSEIE